MHLKSIAAGLALAVFSSLAAAESLSIEGGGAASLTGIVPQTYAQFTSAEGIDLQVVLGQTLTKSALKVAAGKLDLAVIPPPAFRAMSRGVGPYAGQADAAKKLSEDVRSLFAFPGGTFHAIVWADSGIEDWGDIAGKRVFIGPPAGAASGQIQGMIEAASGGMKAGDDYEGVKAPWGAAQQSFQDGQYDVYVAAAAVGQQALNELSLQREIRILGVPDTVVGSDNWTDYTVAQAVDTTVIPAGTYSGQVNADDDLSTAVTMMMVGVNKAMPDDTAYALTKAYWENLASMKSANALLKSIDPEKPFAGTNAPLHPGAVRYYEENGIAIPDTLRPGA
ncbi:TAXI family TRAP transporter solute-binding subunit [Hoeflea sp.]|uniref:TAXI family TRAP transporter solute-binding subunit n=1 Tax=Hoeflea sp. TaxID=1940281 RepID=UPI003B023365